MKKILLLISLTLISLSVFPDTIERDGIFYNLNIDTKEASVTAGTSQYKDDISIPNNINVNGQIFNVTSIEDAAFVGCEELKSVQIPSSITKIGYGIFSGCNALTTIVVSNDNMVYDSRNDCNAIIETESNTLIVGCNNTTIPYSVQSITIRSFENCSKMTNVNIPNSVVGLGGFNGCDNLSEINIPNTVSYLYGETFYGCKSLKTINLSQNLSSISYSCFAKSGLQSILIPNGVNSIEQWAFSMCQELVDVVIPNSVNSIGEWAFENCDALKTIKIPKGLEVLQNNVFYFCDNLQTVYLPATLKSIGNSFDGCWKISDVYCFAKEVPIVDSYAFRLPDIDNNTTLHVPAESIVKYKNASVWNKFGNIVALTDVELKMYDDDSQIIVSDNGIKGIYNTQPDSYRTSSGKQEYGDLNPPIEIVIKENGDGTYYVDDLFGGWYWYCKGYGSNYAMTGNIVIAEDGTVTLKDSHVSGWDDSLISLTGSYDATSSTFNIEAEYVDGLKFYQTWVKDKQVIDVDGINYKIDSNNNASVIKGGYSGIITIPNSISYNGNTYPVTTILSAFSGCSSLTSVTIPNSVTSINSWPSGCSSLTSVTIPNSMTSIGDHAFTDCTGLTSVSIPNSVTSIGYMAFFFCNSLSNLTLSENLTTIGASSFIACNGLKSLIIPASVLKIGNRAFTECEGLESIKVESQNIKYDSRNDCNAIIETHSNRLILGCKNTVIPQDVTTIGDGAFAGCVGIETLDIPQSVTTIENGAFWNCKGLKNFIVGNNVELIDRGAFEECINLSSIVVPSTINKIGQWAFYQCSALKDFYIYAENCPTTDKDAFEETPIENATLHVPAGSVELYKQTSPWSGFGKIVALTEGDPIPTGISSILKNKIKDNIWYDLNGRKFETEPQNKGIYIINGQKVIKK